MRPPTVTPDPGHAGAGSVVNGLAVFVSSRPIRTIRARHGPVLCVLRAPRRRGVRRRGPRGGRRPGPCPWARSSSRPTRASSWPRPWAGPWTWPSGTSIRSIRWRWRLPRTPGAEVERHPAAKDATDLELALEAAAARDPAEIVVVGGAGGRLDHLVGGLLVLAGDALRRRVGPGPPRGRPRPRRARPAPSSPAAPASWSRCWPCTGRPTGVTTDGLLYPLRGETLHPVRLEASATR